MRGKKKTCGEDYNKEKVLGEKIIDNRSAAGDAVKTRTGETGVTRKAWKVPVSSTTRTGDANKVKSNMTHTRKEKEDVKR